MAQALASRTTMDSILGWIAEGRADEESRL